LLATKVNSKAIKIDTLLVDISLEVVNKTKPFSALLQLLRFREVTEVVVSSRTRTTIHLIGILINRLLIKLSRDLRLPKLVVRNTK